MHILSKFHVSLCEKICDKYQDKIEYVEKYGEQRIKKEFLGKIKKDKEEKNEVLKL